MVHLSIKRPTATAHQSTSVQCATQPTTRVAGFVGQKKKTCLRHIPQAWNDMDDTVSHPMMPIIGGLSSAYILAMSTCLSGSAYAAECPDFTTASSGDAKGLQFCDLKVGDGDAPVKGSFIKVHYEGRLDSDSASGTFDSSYDRRRPLGFSVGIGQVIRGWDFGILGDGGDIPAMKAGGKRKLVIPADLGYGARGAGGVIPPNATLYFDVEYLGRLGKK